MATIYAEEQRITSASSPKNAGSVLVSIEFEAILKGLYIFGWFVWVDIQQNSPRLYPEQEPIDVKMESSKVLKFFRLIPLRIESLIICM
jgi:hypothetical protein